MTYLDRKTAPATTELSGMALPMADRHTLPNGVKLVVIDSGSQPVTRMAVVHPGGKLDIDSPQLYPLLMASISEGTATRPAAEIAEALEYNGAWTNFSAGRHNCVSNLYGLNSRASETIPIFAEILSKPLLSTETVQSQCKKLAASTELTRKKISAQATELWLQTAYGTNHPAARTITGNDFAGIDAEAVGQLHRDAFLGEAPTIYIAGRVTDDILKLVEDNFGVIDYKTGRGIARRVLPPAYPPEGMQQFRHVAESLQTAIKTGIPTLDRTHPDYEHMRLATIALGGYFGSRLMTNIREEKGYTYGISATPSPHHEGTFIIIECQTANQYAQKVLDEIGNEIDTLASDIMPEEELTGIRRLMLSSMASILDSPFSVLDYTMSLDMFDLPHSSFNKQIEAVTSVTPAQIRDAAARYFSGKPRLTALAGDNTEY